MCMRRHESEKLMPLGGVVGMEQIQVKEKKEGLENVKTKKGEGMSRVHRYIQGRGIYVYMGVCILKGIWIPTNFNIKSSSLFIIHSPHMTTCGYI